MSQKHIWSIIGFCMTAWWASAQGPVTPHFDGQSWWQHVKVLADDRMEGRETGTSGLRKAEAYVVEQLKVIGLATAGTKSFYQPVRLVSRRVDENRSSLGLVRNGQVEPLTLGDDAFFSNRSGASQREIDAPLVFVGYGLKVPEKNYDDITGPDLKGKVAVILSGSPAEVPAEVASHYQSLAERWKALRPAGAIGMITVSNPAVTDVPWSRTSSNRLRPSLELDYAEFDETAGQKFAIIFNPTRAERLFSGTGHTFQELAELAKKHKPLPRFVLPLSVRAAVSIKKRTIKSANIVAALPGNDPVLKNEYVVLSAHIDHLGIDEPVQGDRIYNGAMDNASGCALLLDVAAALKKHQTALRRSVLFVFVTGEEKGLLGSKYFAAHPTIEPKSMVADLNVDMFLPIVPLKVLTVYGLGESDLGDRIKEVARGFGIRVQPDPEPSRNIFVRSDQYSFVRHGVPAVAMGVGFEAGSLDAAVFKKWFVQRYHAPSDDLEQAVDLVAAAQYEEVYLGVLLAVSNADQRPQWRPESFFRRYERQNGN